MDNSFLERCNYLARLGRGHVQSNPQVGAVITNAEDEILGEGLHRHFGFAHAEVNAFKSIERLDQDVLSDLKLYVNLEPCHHHGKTPACTSAIVRQPVSEVYVGNVDPNPKVNGTGMDFLQSQGVKVRSDFKKDSVKDQPLKFFFHYLAHKTPFVTLKFSSSRDGFLAKKGERTKITSLITDRYVHRLRGDHQAIMVGTNTVIIDNPKLDVRKFYGRDPDVVILDRKCRLSGNENVFSGERKIIYFTTDLTKIKIEIEDNPNVKIVSVGNDNWILEHILFKLGELGIISLMIEGGSKLLESFLETGLWNEAVKIVAPIVLEDGVSAPKLNQDLLVKSDEIDRDKIYFYQKLKNA